MPQVINITDEDINYAERILLPEGKNFDPERIKFIRNLNILDLQAVPGSGKTTALLAKLLILERKLPFNDGSGILVLSHTNSAIDEISGIIQKYCPKLFSYPNFIGTIQSFVDVFLAIPFYINQFKEKPYRIDSEVYNECIEKNFPFNLPKFSIQEQKNARYFVLSNNLLYSFRLRYLNNSFTLLDSISGKELVIKKPRRGKNWVDFSSLEKEKIKEWLIKFKVKILKKGILHFDDAYTLAEMQLANIPIYKTLIQKRFSYVFVDEMQDMDEHQYNLLESIFYDEGKSISIYQRIGDKNQAIFNSVKVRDIWNDRELVLPLKGSQRLTKPIADVLNYFALYRNETFEIIGLRNGGLKPHILLYNNDTIKDVIPFFSDIIKTYKKNDKLVDLDKYPIKVISWNTEWKTQEEKDDLTKIRLVDYHSKFEKDKNRPKQDYDCLKSYLLFFDHRKQTLEPIRKNILNALLKVLRLEEIEDKKNRYFTKKSLLVYLNDKDLLEATNNYETLKLYLYNWSIGIIRNKIEEMWNEIKLYIPEFIRIFGKEINKSSHFITDDTGHEREKEENINENNPNQLQIDGLNIEITTVHGAKGQTHCATLYLESYYHQDGKGENSKSYESERLADQFLGKPISMDAGQHVKESLKMAYVGLSRATNLLCLAIHEDRFKKHLSNIDNDKWEIMKVIPKN
jgi:DNA helicase II / ATP-dependent DNA helicase PcrA